VSAALTPWFPANLKPVRVGVYGTRLLKSSTARSPNAALDREGYSYWDGHYWGHTHGTVRQAYANRRHKSPYQNKPWQGRLKEPKP